jgi:hypothetical protein
MQRGLALVVAALGLLAGASAAAMYDQTNARLDPDCPCQTGFEVNCTDSYPMLRSWELLSSHKCNETGSDGVHPKCAINKSCSLWFYVLTQYRYGERCGAASGRAAGRQRQRCQRPRTPARRAPMHPATRAPRTPGAPPAASAASPQQQAPSMRARPPLSQPCRLPAQRLALRDRARLPLLPGRQQRLRLLQLLPAALLQLVLPALPQVGLRQPRRHAGGLGHPAEQLQGRQGLLRLAPVQAGLLLPQEQPG